MTAAMVEQPLWQQQVIAAPASGVAVVVVVAVAASGPRKAWGLRGERLGVPLC